MRRLLPLFLLLFTLPALAGLFDDPAPRGVIDDAPLNNSSDFLPVREAFRLSLVSSDAQSVKLRFVAAEGYYLYRHQFKFNGSYKFNEMQRKLLLKQKRSKQQQKKKLEKPSSQQTTECRKWMSY